MSSSYRGFAAVDRETVSVLIVNNDQAPAYTDINRILTEVITYQIAITAAGDGDFFFRAAFGNTDLDEYFGMHRRFRLAAGLTLAATFTSGATIALTMRFWLDVARVIHFNDHWDGTAGHLTFVHVTDMFKQFCFRFDPRRSRCSFIVMVSHCQTGKPEPKHPQNHRHSHVTSPKI